MQHTMIDDRTAMRRLGICVLGMVGLVAVLIIAIAVAV